MINIGMKRAALAVASVASFGSANAQSSVTIGGIIDTTVSSSKGSGPLGSSLTQLTSAGYNGSRLNFRGSEFLGDDLTASFWLEMGFNPDDGTGNISNSNNQTSGNSTGQSLTFNRRSTVSLSNALGEIRVGRDFIAPYLNRVGFDPFVASGVGVLVLQSLNITGPTAVRVSNMIGYYLPPNLGGFYGQAQKFFGENRSGVDNPNDGDGYAARLGYSSGPLNIIAGSSRTRYVAGDVKQNNISGSWDFNVVKVFGQIEYDKNAQTTGKGALLGAIFPIGLGQIHTSYSFYNIDRGTGIEPKSAKFALGYLHNLSKRTAVYTSVAQVKNSNGAALSLGGTTTSPNRSSSGVDFGIRHIF